MSDLPTGWDKGKLDDMLDYIQPTKFIVESTEYNKDFQTPVLTAGKSFIKGYTNETDGIFTDHPVIIFDDFTTATKFVDFPFKVKSSAMKILTPKHEAVNIKYVFYFMQTLRETTETHKRYWISIFSKLPIPLAPVNEQRRIVARIEELFSRLDAGVAALRQAKAQLQRYRQSVLAAAVTGQLTQAWREQHPDTEPASELLERILEQRREQWTGRGNYREPAATQSLSLKLPSTWTITNIDSVISGIEAGKNFKCEERPPTEGETGLVKISAVTWGKFDELESKTVTRDDQIREEHVIHSGDFLLSRANTLELVGAPVIVEQITRHLMLSDKVRRFRFIERLEKFALFWLRSKLGRKEIESRATGNQLSMRNIAQASLREIPLPLPPLAEQHQIVAEVEARTTAIDHLEAELDHQLTRSNRLRQSTLRSAFCGTLV